MGRLGSTTSVRARQMRRLLVRWQGSGLTLREFGQQRGVPVSTLSWWRQVFRRAGEEAVNGAPAENAVVFSEVPQPANVPMTPSVLEIILHSGPLVRVPAGADTDTLQRVLQALQRFWLLYKRLEAGTFAALERDEINARELYLLLEGIEVVRERRRYTRLPISV